MTQSSSARTGRGRVFPERHLSLEEKAKRRTEAEAFYQRCRTLFEQLRPGLILEYHNWFISIEPDSGDYIIDMDRDNLLLKSLQKYPHKKGFIFRLNETGVCGTI